jgi:hypothetical protein
LAATFDPADNYFWLSCEMASTNFKADRAVPAESRALVRMYACIDNLAPCVGLPDAIVHCPVLLYFRHYKKNAQMSAGVRHAAFHHRRSSRLSSHQEAQDL